MVLVTHFVRLIIFPLHDIITKIFNKQTKRQEGPHCARFSTDIARVNTWVAHLISMQKLGKIFWKKYNKIQAWIIKNAHLGLKCYE